MRSSKDDHPDLNDSPLCPVNTKGNCRKQYRTIGKPFFHHVNKASQQCTTVVYHRLASVEAMRVWINKDSLYQNHRDGCGQTLVSERLMNKEYLILTRTLTYRKCDAHIMRWLAYLGFTIHEDLISMQKHIQNNMLIYILLTFTTFLNVGSADLILDSQVSCICRL